MSRRPRKDWVDWRLYRVGWLVPALFLIVVLATSFHRPAPLLPAQPALFDGGSVRQVVDNAHSFAHRFPDRRAGASQSIQAAQWVGSQFKSLGLHVQMLPAVAQTPRTSNPVGIVDVLATLPGRSRSAVVIWAPRDNMAKGDVAGSADTAALLRIARQLALNQDRRRTYVFVSTDAAAEGAAGAAAAAQELVHRRGGVFAAIGLDRIGDAAAPRVPLIAAGNQVTPLGLNSVLADSLSSEDIDSAQAGTLQQFAQLALPANVYEQAAFTRATIPAAAITTRPTSTFSQATTAPINTTNVGVVMNATMRALSTLTAVDALPTAGKTYVQTGSRIYRGWALKLFIASLLAPAWLAASAMFVRSRRVWMVGTATGSLARAAIAGVVALLWLWILAAFHVIPRSVGAAGGTGIHEGGSWGYVVWALLAIAGWVVLRGPDWRYSREHGVGAQSGAIAATVCGAVLVSTLLAVIAMVSNPYALILLVPATHIWLTLCSRVTAGRGRRVAAWCGTLIIPVALLGWIASHFGVAFGWPAIRFTLGLVRDQQLAAGVALPLAATFGISAVVLAAVLGRLGSPVLPRLRGLHRRPGAPLDLAARHSDALLHAAHRAARRAAGGMRQGDTGRSHQPASSAHRSNLHRRQRDETPSKHR